MGAVLGAVAIAAGLYYYILAFRLGSTISADRGALMVVLGIVGMLVGGAMCALALHG